MGKHILVAVWLAGTASTLAAQDWVAPDARSRAMGNAGVALTDGPAAAYWNPASLAAGAEEPFDFSTGWGLSLYASAEAVLEGDVAALVQHVDDAYSFYSFVDIQDRANGIGGPYTDTDLQNTIQIVDAILNTDRAAEGVLVNAAAGVDVRVGPFAIFTRGIGTLSGDPLINFSDFAGSALTNQSQAAFFGSITPPPGALSPEAQNLSAQLQAAGLTGDLDGDGSPDADELAYHSEQSVGNAGISDPAFIAAMEDIVAATLANQGGAGTNTLYFTDSGVEIRSVIQVEAGIGFGLPVIPTLFEVGISLKEIISETFYRKVVYSEEQNDDLADIVIDEFRNNRKRSNDFNIDIGAIVRPTPWLTVGLSARNILPMELDFTGGGSVKLDPQVRAGAAVRPLGFLQVGVDIDVVENDSDLLPGYESRFFGAGFELDFPVVKIRGGYFDNVADSLTGGAVTAGIGLELWFFTLDLAAQMGLDEAKQSLQSLDGQDPEELIPERLNVALSIGFDFRM